MLSINTGCFQEEKSFTTTCPLSQTPATHSSHILSAGSWGPAGSQIKVEGIITNSSLGLGFMYWWEYEDLFLVRMLFSSCYIPIQILQHKVSEFFSSIQEEIDISEHRQRICAVHRSEAGLLTRGTFAGTFCTRLGTSYEEGNTPLLPQRKNQTLWFRMNLFEKISNPSKILLYKS